VQLGVVFFFDSVVLCSGEEIYDEKK